MDKSAKIYVAGHHGLVGSAIWNNLKERGYNNLVGRSHKELDLLDPIAVKKFFDEEQPDAVILAAAHVGGIMANLQYRADFIYQNLQIQQNVIGSRGEEVAVPGQYLHLSARSPAADEGRSAPHLPAGIYERTVCHRKDCGTEDV